MTRSAGWPGWAGPRTSRTCARCCARTAAPCLNARSLNVRGRRRGAGDGARPGALLIRATLDPSHGHPAADHASPGRADPGEAGRGRAETGPDGAPADPPRNPPASRRQPAAPPRQPGKPSRRDQRGGGPRGGAWALGAAVAGSRRVHDRVRQRIGAAAPAPDDLGPGAGRPRPVAGVADHVGQLPAVPPRRRGAAAGRSGPGPADQPARARAVGVRAGRARARATAGRPRPARTRSSGPPGGAAWPRTSASRWPA